MGAFCGIDWASDWHDVHITDELGGEPAAKQFSHDERGRSAHWSPCCRPTLSSAARSSARMACWWDGSWPAAYRCLRFTPTRVNAARDRFRAAAGKSDRFDAMVLCELARTDRHRFPALAPCGDEMVALRALVRHA